jgi:hypothetical protein
LSWWNFSAKDLVVPGAIRMSWQILVEGNFPLVALRSLKTGLLWESPLLGCRARGCRAELKRAGSYKGWQYQAEVGSESGSS